jgi:uncharacterized protein (TIGR02118 family)
MLKIILFWTRRPDMTHGEAVRYWLDRHAPLVARTFGDHLVRYLTNVGLPGNYSGWSPDEAPPFDGVSEFWFDMTREEFARVRAANADVLVPDEKAFCGTYRIMFVEEIAQKG